MAFRKDEKAEREIHQTMLIMDWIEGVGRDPEDLCNYSDKSYEAAKEWTRRNKLKELATTR
jgi:hypothetical protein